MIVLEKCHQSECETGKGRSGGDGEKIEWKSSEVNTRVVSRGQYKLNKSENDWRLNRALYEVN